MYKVIYDNRIGKDTRTIPKNILQSIFRKIDTLRTNPRHSGATKLIGIEGWRVRVGKYRVLFQIDSKKKIVKIYRIKHRKESYR